MDAGDTTRWGEPPPEDSSSSTGADPTDPQAPCVEETRGPEDPAAGNLSEPTYVGDLGGSALDESESPNDEATRWEGDAPPPNATPEGATVADRTEWSGDGAPPGTRPRAPALHPGAEVGPYLLVAPLGEGGMGVVYRAQDPVAGREVALKVIRGQLSTAQRQRFVREGQLTASLNHPNLVRVHAAGEFEDMPYLVYELVTGGRTLKESLYQAERPEQLRQLRDAARGLGHAHAQGVIHRDVKPANVLIDGEGHVRVADFGLALSDEVERLTRTGALMGTPAYMAPEQSERERTGPWTDVWALGIMLFEVLTGQRPFPGVSGPELHRLVRQQDVPSPASLDASVSPELNAICLKALAREPAQRYPDAAALADDLQRVLEGGQPSVAPCSPPPPARRILLAGLVVLVLALGVAWAWRSSLAQPSTLEPPRVSFAPPHPVRGGLLELSARLYPPGAQARIEGALGRVRPGEEPGLVTLVLPIKPGENTFRVVVRAGGERAISEVRVTGLAPWPEWYSQLEERPPRRADLTPGEDENTYRWSQDGSLFAWIPPGNPVIGNLSVGKPIQGSLTQGFYLGLHEVTWASFDAYRSAQGRPLLERTIHKANAKTDGLEDSLNRSAAPFRGGDRHPAVCVTWVEAQAYCAWAGARLPSAMEWEWAARGPGARLYPWGDEAPRRQTCNRGGSADGYSHTSPVGAFPLDRAAFGCFDMGGNVREWVQDGFVNPRKPGPWRDYVAPHLTEYREVRGGSWPRRFTVGFTASIRSSQHIQSTRLVDVGLRIVLDAPRGERAR